MNKSLKKILHNPLFIAVLITFLGVLVRLYRLPSRLYFIWDQGRDTAVWRNIVENFDPVLVGPTSGIQGFFLGPLWYYVGLIGFILAGGNPFGFSTWLVLMGCLAIPFFWLLSHQLFSDKKWAITSTLALTFLPGAISSGSFIWNPLISIPLVSASYWALLKSRNSRWFLSLAFFLFALTLQSEFAYAIFFIAPMWLSIGWIRQKIDWKDYLSTAVAVGITLVPQLLFELRNGFIMSNSLFRSIASKENTFGWIDLFKMRPVQLFYSTKNILYQGLPLSTVLTIITIIAVLATSYYFFKKRPSKKQQASSVWKWQLSAGLAILPYILYMFWRGNYGYFFDYYLTPHFIFIIPLLIKGIQLFSDWLEKKSIKNAKMIFLYLVAGFFVSYFLFSIWRNVITMQNNVGLEVMIDAVKKIEAWRVEDLGDDQEQAVVRIFTPNQQTENHDYLFYWYSKENNSPTPSTVFKEDTDTWYILMENDSFAPGSYRFNPWYQEATRSGVLVRRENVGDLKLETWMNPEEATLLNRTPLPFSRPDVGLPEPAGSAKH